MKKNNLLMSAYIAFVFLCFVIRTFGEYPMWDSVVASVTFSSAFFAYADFFFSYANALSDVCDVADSFIGVTKKKLIVENAAFEEMSKQMDSVSEDKFDFLQIKESIIPIEKKHNEMESWIDSYINDINEKRKKIKTNIFIGEMLTFFGFFSFMCILVFLPITKAVVKVQDILSVLAFAIILLSNMNSVVQEDKLAKEKRGSEKAKKEYEECRKKLKEMQKLINKLVSVIKDTNEEREKNDKCKKEI